MWQVDARRVQHYKDLRREVRNLRRRRNQMVAGTARDDM